MSVAGKHFLVTRPADQADDLRQRLEQRGARVSVLPMIVISPPDSWEAFDVAAAQLADYDWIVFASVNAVQATVERFAELKVRLPESVRVAAIGPATANAAIQCGMKVSFCPEKFVAEALVESFPNYPDLSGTKVFWPKTNIGRTYIADHLAEAGARVDIAHCYQTIGPIDRKAAAAQLSRLLSGGLDVVTLTSSETVRNFKSCLDELESGVLQNTLIAVIGPETAQTAIATLGRADIQATSFTIPGLVEAIEGYFDKNPHHTNKKK